MTLIPMRDFRVGLKACLGTRPKKLFFSGLVHFVVGDGRDTYFWEDKWVGVSPLCSMFPSLYHLSSMKNRLVVDLVVLFGSSLSILGVSSFFG